MSARRVTLAGTALATAALAATTALAASGARLAPAPVAVAAPPLALAPAARPAPAARARAADVSREALGDGLWLFRGPGGNVLAALDARGALLVDAMDAESAAAILAALDELGAGPRRLAVKTHWHADHTDGDAALAAAGLTVIAHANVRARRAVEQDMPALGLGVPALPAGALPALTYRERLTLHGRAGRVELHHVPAAHTDGDTLVHLVDRDLLHTGDLFEGDDYPFLDVHAGGSLDGLVAALETALALCGPHTRVIPGHGEPSTPDDLRRTLAMLRDTRARLAPLVDEDLSLEAILERDPLSDHPTHWADGFISRRGFTYTAAQSLALARAADAAAGDHDAR